MQSEIFCSLARGNRSKIGQDQKVEGFFCSAGLSSSSGNYLLRQRESVQTVLKLQINIILITYIIIKLLINENHPGQNWKQNSPERLSSKNVSNFTSRFC